MTFRSRQVWHVAHVITCLVLTLPAHADDAAAIRLDKQMTSRWRFGVEVQADGGPVTGIVATLPVPMDWPEQKVEIVEEDISAGVKVSYRIIDKSVKQMVVAIPKLADGQQSRAVVTFNVEKNWIEAPQGSAGLRIPKPSRDLARFLAPSPFIESNDARIKRVAAEIASPDEPWQQAEELFTWVRKNIRYEFAETMKPAVDALQARQGDCEELSSLFIALCRVRRIPARAVWVPGHTYPEFYLEDEAGQGHWYPCQAAGELPDFGRMPEDRPILQKGDNLRLPDDRTPQRYAKQTLRAKNAAAPPKVNFIMEEQKAED